MRYWLKPIISFCLVIVLFTSCTNMYYDQTRGFYRKYDVTDFLTYFDAIKKMNPEELRLEYDRQDKRSRVASGYHEQIRYALLLNLPGTGFQDNERALGILNGIIDSKLESESSIRKFAFLLGKLIQQESQMAHLYKKTQQSLNHIIEEERINENIYRVMQDKYNRTILEKKENELSYRRMQEKLKMNELLVKKLQQKIEKLKAIERTINERKNVKPPST